MKRNLGAPSWSAFVIITFATLAAPDRLPGEQPGVPAQREAISDDVARPYARLDPDTAWCGPRVLYFFARLLGQDCTLRGVVESCHTDPARVDQHEPTRDSCRSPGATAPCRGV